METNKKKDLYNTHVKKRYLDDFIKGCRIINSNLKRPRLPDLELDFDLNSIFNSKKEEFVNSLYRFQSYQRTLKTATEFKEFLLDNFDERVIRIDFADSSLVEYLISLHKSDMFKYEAIVEEICCILVVLLTFNPLSHNQINEALEFTKRVLSLSIRTSLYYSILLTINMMPEKGSDYVLDSYFEYINNDYIEAHVDKNSYILSHCSLLIGFLHKATLYELKHQSYFRIATFAQHLFNNEISDENMAHLIKLMIKVIEKCTDSSSVFAQVEIIKKCTRIVKRSQDKVLVGLTVQLLLNITTTTDKTANSVIVSLGPKIFKVILRLMKEARDTLLENCCICLSNILLNKTFKLEKSVLLKTIYNLPGLLSSEQSPAAKFELLLLLRNLIANITIQLMVEIITYEPDLIDAICCNINHELEERIVLNALHALNSLLEMDKVFELELGSKFIICYIEDKNLVVCLEKAQYHGNEVVQSLVDFIIGKYFDYDQEI